jgi:hypothetical protein
MISDREQPHAKVGASAGGVAAAEGVCAASNRQREHDARTDKLKLRLGPPDLRPLQINVATDLPEKILEPSLLHATRTSPF